MKTKTSYLGRRFALTIVCMAMSAGIAFSQGNNWKLNLNNNVGENNGIGIYTYSLIADGQVLDTKKMVRAK